MCFVRFFLETQKDVRLKLPFLFFGNSNLYHFSSPDADQRPRPKVLDIVSRLLWCVAQGLIFDPWTALGIGFQESCEEDNIGKDFLLIAQWMKKDYKKSKVQHFSFACPTLCVVACLEIRILAATFLHSHLHRTDAIGCLRCWNARSIFINFQYTVVPIATLAANAMFPERISPRFSPP